MGNSTDHGDVKPDIFLGPACTNPSLRSEDDNMSLVTAYAIEGYVHVKRDTLGRRVGSASTEVKRIRGITVGIYGIPRPNWKFTLLPPATRSDAYEFAKTVLPLRQVPYGYVPDSD